MFRFQCPNQHRLKSKDDPTGKPVSCPECAVAFEVNGEVMRSNEAFVSRLPDMLKSSPGRNSLSDTGAMRIIDG